VIDVAPSRQVVELNACGLDDPDGSRTAQVLDAYFEAEHALAFRRVLWRRLTLLAAAWGLIATLFLSGSVLIGGLLVIIAAAGYAVLLEWHTGSRLSRLIDDHGISRAAVPAPRKGALLS
jgi:hypothetical protein